MKRISATLFVSFLCLPLLICGGGSPSTPTQQTPSGPARFSLSSSASSLSVTQNGDNTSTITVNPSGGFTSTVALSVSGLQKGVTASFSAENTATTSVLTLTADSTATGAATAIVTGVSGSITQTVKIKVTVATPTVASQQGTWVILSTTTPDSLNPIHAALLHTNKILFVSGSGNCPTTLKGCPQQNNYPEGAGVFDLATQTFTTIATDWDMFCNGMSIMPDGRVLLNGGTKTYGELAPVGMGSGDLPYLGLPNTSIFDPSSDTFINAPPTAHGRWYPTLTELGDGRIMTTSGLLDHYGTNGDNNNNNTSEIWNGTSWGTPIPSVPNAAIPSYPNFLFHLYPRLHLLPTGHLFYSAPDSATLDFDPSTSTWTFVTWTLYPCSGPDQNCNGTTDGDRTYGSSVLLPLTPSNNYDPKVMIMGGDNPATWTTELIDLDPNIQHNCTYGTYCFVEGPPMVQARVDMEATIMPNGKVLVDSGSSRDEDASTTSLKAQIYDPVANAFTEAAPNALARLYHNVQLLLPDGTILLAGSNPAQGQFEKRMELYTPPYLYNPDGSKATRPTITSAPANVTYGSSFTVQTPNTDTAAVALLKPGSVTHSFDMDQRYVGLSFTNTSGGLNVSMSAIDSNLAPPGYYMLFIVNKAGTPSLSAWVNVNGTAAAVKTVELHPERVPTPAYVIRRHQVSEAPLMMRKEMHQHMMAQPPKQ
jgi:galactose oxidase-like protein